MTSQEGRCHRSDRIRHQPPDAAAGSRQAGDARFRDDAGRDRQAMWMCLAIDIASAPACTVRRASLGSLNGNPVHRREVDDNAIIDRACPATL